MFIGRSGGVVGPGDDDAVDPFDRDGDCGIVCTWFLRSSILTLLLTEFKRCLCGNIAILQENPVDGVDGRVVQVLAFLE